ncbi:DUF7097 family protein [Halostagnicola kamekurae]|uniref:Uncharacterized protein n=1 Tax=Halostagnicola kamekurae TaxID=619731 RepID=A0A1I6QBS4_9EURY|nr:hypothetical protein [Halostagnicola kamekurae]SFS49919.1 hypothetical protein SAMN04488556_1157 [Halostagnicola kamekurae]
MEKTPRGTSVGVDDPYEFAGLCDHLTGEGRCRYAFDHYEHDPEFARERAEDDYTCPPANPESEATWADCPHFRSRKQDRECVRCGLEEKRNELTEERPLLEEHHLSYRDTLEKSANAAGDGKPAGNDETAVGDEPAGDGADDGELSHEITIYLCRWCHAKVHNSWARITDDVAPDPAAVAALEERRGRELEETGFESAADRYGE